MRLAGYAALATLFDTATDGRRFWVLVPGVSTMFTGTAGRESLLTGLPVPPGQIVSAVFGEPYGALDSTLTASRQGGRVALGQHDAHRLDGQHPHVQVRVGRKSRLATAADQCGAESVHAGAAQLLADRLISQFGTNCIMSARRCRSGPAVRCEALGVLSSDRLFSPSAERNKGPISEVLSQVLPECGVVLEVGRRLVHPVAARNDPITRHL